MTDNAKKFFEFLSAQDEGTRGKAAKLEKDALIAFAAEKGFPLADADFEKQEEEGEVSMDEADAVAGGGDCVCAIAGGGTADMKERDNGEGKYGNKACACVLYGQGDWEDYVGKDVMRCACAGAGFGDDR